MSLILIIGALVCFVLAALDARSRINLVAAGLACWIASNLIGRF
jgi:hypothetical protein